MNKSLLAILKLVNEVKLLECSFAENLVSFELNGYLFIPG